MKRWLLAITIVSVINVLLAVIGWYMGGAVAGLIGIALLVGAITYAVVQRLSK